MLRRLLALLLALTLLLGCLTSCEALDSFLGSLSDPPEIESPDNDGTEKDPDDATLPAVSLDGVPEFNGTVDFVYINDNKPFFDGSEDTSRSYEIFSDLDYLGRCGVAMANIGTDIMPTEPREEIGHVRPSGWHSVSYDVVPGGNLYNRAHLIGFQLTGENDNEKNLITGTRNLNNEGMLPFENDIAAYMKANPENHVLYRVTPIFVDNELVARGVLMEAKSVEDNGEGICFCIYVYNCQEGVTINYKTGESRLADHPHAGVITDSHDALDIIPAAASDFITHMYLEYDEDEEIIGAVVITSMVIHGNVIIVATDLREDGVIDKVTIISDTEVYPGFVDSLAGLDEAAVNELQLPSNEQAVTGTVREAAYLSILGFKAYIDALENGYVYIVNINKSSMKFHDEDCRYAVDMKEENKLVYIGYAADLVEAGYTACGSCDPE